MFSSQSTSFFSLPLAAWQQPQSFRKAKYEPRKRQRKHHDPDDSTEGEDRDSDNNAIDTSNQEDANNDSNEDHESDTDPYSSRASTAAPSSIVLSPNEAHQYRIAGYPTNRELPGGRFPHAAPPSDRTQQRVTKNNIQTELSKLSTPVFIPESAGQRSLRLQHLSVITTILHRCLMEGDYTRAGRAWGLILRDEFGGHAMDVRNEGRWGIGAEILLWKDDEAGSTEDTEVAQKTSNQRRWFTRKGFERAKDYYERLILHYPYRKAAPNALGPLDFYPAMFGLWISVVQEESQVVREAAFEAEDSNDYDMDDHYDPEDDMTMPGNPMDVERRREREQAIADARARELSEAQQIAAQMDELLVSPPYSDSYEMLRLRGMISLWIADLHISSVVSEEDADTSMADLDGPSVNTDFEMAGSFLARMEQGLGVERKEAEVEKANEFFEKARSRERRTPVVLGGLQIDD
ncbi:hypothetical protein AJ80_05120 [Polytolypa hystricis UAMH7299]|uniref:RNA polymerase I-specific transcription initiation factor rrn11 n=1 Tax=Polytolypa hystricis (strain UAMH7299) TaxID=1447883 RepID=A0A2B7Y6U8_POLH7|nr:hypothetical protein AJ80_05120 [Polytolypa hystricis UAMH7299]